MATLFTTDAQPREREPACRSIWRGSRHGGRDSTQGQQRRKWRAYFEGRGARPRGDWQTPTPRVGTCADSGIVYPVREQRRAAA